MEEQNKKIIFLIIAVVVLFALAIFSGYFLAKRIGENRAITKKGEIAQMNNEEFRMVKAPIYQLINEDNFEEAINRMNSILKENPSSNSNQEANLKIILGETYINDLKEADFKKGIAILKEVANNIEYTNRLRAIALDRLAFYSVAHGSSFAKENIFNDIYFSAMMEEGTLSVAQRRLYEKSLTLQKTVIPYYEIADWYAIQLLENKSLSAESKKSFLQSANVYFRRGEELFNKEAPWDKWDPERLILAHKRYGEVATKLYLLKEFDDGQKIVDSFNKAIAVYEENYNIKKWPVAKNEIPEFLPRMQLPMLVYAYASSLAMMQKPVDQDKMQALLEILYDKNWNEANIFNALAYLENRKDPFFENRYSRLGIVSLAKADSRFANLLMELGWEKADLSKMPVLPFMAEK